MQRCAARNLAAREKTVAAGTAFVAGRLAAQEHAPRRDALGALFLKSGCAGETDTSASAYASAE